MRNIKLTLQYDGTDYCGFGRQKNGPSIQAAIEKALQKLFKTPTKIIGASRTDAGVHACCQVVSFKTKNSIPIKNIPQALNGCLPPAIRIVGASEVGPKYNPRFAAKSKIYEYLIYNGEVLNPLFNRFVWRVRPKLNIAAMKKAAKYLVGKHDFSSFCAAHGDDKDHVRVIHQLVIRNTSCVIWNGCQSRRFGRDPESSKYKVESGLSAVSCKLVGNGFLYKMVRNIVGTLVEVGMGKRKYTDMEQILAEKDRKKAGITAPPQGLCLVKVNF